jgi:hypothetical protein
MNHTGPEISSPLAKMFAAWGAVGIGEALQAFGINTWGDAAQAVAFLLTLCYLAEFWMKRMWFPLFRRLGWMKPLPPKAETVE